MDTFSFDVTSSDKKSYARTGIVHTPHGDISTPAFVPVGTQATVKSLTPKEIQESGTQLFFVNTYHMYLRPGMSVIKKSGGIHQFMGWDGPIITDSGGFQVFSLGRKRFVKKDDEGKEQTALVKIDENGVEFQSHWDGTKHMFTPEVSMQYQWTLGSDIHIAFDDCTPYGVAHEEAKKSMDRTHRWAVRSLTEHNKVKSQKSNVKSLTQKSKFGKHNYQALYGSIQGSVFEDLRVASAKFITHLPFDGYAIGGVAVGESKREMKNVLDWVLPILPSDKPRHLLGVGELDDIVDLIYSGMDTFDCVGPTRLARMGIVYSNVKNQMSTVKENLLDINKKTFENDLSPIDASCQCYTCQHFSRAYLHHLFHVRELLSYRLATIHNMTFIHTFVEKIRCAIQNGTFHDFYTSFHEHLK